MKQLSLLDKEDLKEVFMEVLLPLMKEMQQQQVKALTDASNNDLLSRKEAAAYLKITLVTLNAWTRQGTISSMRICGRVYYSKSELEQVAQSARRA